MTIIREWNQFVPCLIRCCRDIYALCEAFPTPFAEKLYYETEKLLRQFVQKLSEVTYMLTPTPHTLTPSHTDPHSPHWPHTPHKLSHPLATLSERCSISGQLVQLLQSCITKEVHSGYWHSWSTHSWATFRQSHTSWLTSTDTTRKTFCL